MGPDLLEVRLKCDSRTRTFAVHTPSCDNAPLVLVLHGNRSGTPDRSPRDWARFAARADEWGIAVAYPDGWDGCWADGRGVTTADTAGVDDVGFLCTVIDWFATEFGSPAGRAVIAGISNGAFMSHRMAVQAADQVAVFAAVAGGLPEALTDRTATHAVSAMLINGDADPVTPITGGYSRHRDTDGELRGRTWGLAESAAWWRERDDCSPIGETRRTEFSDRRRMSGGVGGTEVVEWTVFGGGHTWPGLPVPAEWSGYPGAVSTMEFDAAEEIWRFAKPPLTPAAARKL
ncbi:hypothetical protein GFY24_24115 [Nocardia sp. SYP-A9097]|uniref:alpha/beta hydrolase family esterase n=1 Tax=Nocardia sp. SYP-A9097 TaxID=2663237 RepID=UPI00129ABCB9|nr:PHB depolymerase family esterase [Nocardia sp. SYP-A9097]MRH90492.1 hypothetical protein [Nocardia sp. SYP-A9097]